jgi:TP901 family phage tail tape measure protein
VGGSISGVLDLAAAANIGLADAATITANTFNTFGLDAEAAAGVANVLAGAANASSADVSDLAQGMKMAGAVFASNGQSVEDMAAALAILSNNGIAGADAGTSLKTMLMRLAAPTGEAATAMQQLGLNVYDSTGAIVPFGDMLGQLESSLQGLTDEQRNAALTTIFGADAIRAATILAGEGAAGFAAMQEAVTEEGSAAALAQANMSGLSGAIQYFKGSIDSLLIKTATPYLEMLSQMIRGAADLFTRFSSLPRSVQRFAAVLTGVLAVGGPLLIILGTMATGLALLLGAVAVVPTSASCAGPPRRAGPM